MLCHAVLFTCRLLRYTKAGLNGQRGQSSAGPDRALQTAQEQNRSSRHTVTVAGMIANLIDSRDYEVLSKISKSEHCIKEIILHVGTPTVVERLVDFLMEIECAKLFHLSNRTGSPHDFLERVERPTMPLQFCVDPGVLHEHAGPNLAANARVMSALLDQLMDTARGNEYEPVFCFLWDVQISLTTVSLCI